VRLVGVGSADTHRQTHRQTVRHTDRHTDIRLINTAGKANPLQ